MDSTMRKILSETINKFDGNVMETTDKVKDDVSGMIYTTNVNMQVSHKSDDIDDDNSGIWIKFSLKHCYLDNVRKMPHNSSTN